MNRDKTWDRNFPLKLKNSTALRIVPAILKKNVSAISRSILTLFLNSNERFLFALLSASLREEITQLWWCFYSNLLKLIERKSPTQVEFKWINGPRCHFKDKIAFQWDAYRPLVDRIPACTTQWGVPSWGVYLPEGYLHGGCIPACDGTGTPPCEQTDWQTGVKT